MTVCDGYTNLLKVRNGIDNRINDGSNRRGVGIKGGER